MTQQTAEERKDYKLRKIAQAFMDEDPEEYKGETVEQLMEQLRQTSDSFIQHAFEMYYPEENN